MPFKLKLKKSKQYSIASKSLCVIAVKLLENSTVECIVSSRTLGQECLNNVCQRLQIQQAEYFGLRYQSKQGELRWVDLERPLKRQLDKYSSECTLYLGVMFHVFDVDRLHNDVTRYYYFSHLKSDVIEGKLPCTREEAIQLASYSLQAEFGDHRPEHHTPDYLKNFVLLPKRIDNQEVLLEQIVQAHRNLQGIHHSLAEVYYILAVQRLTGYGEELFQVRDAAGEQVVLGISVKGITAKHDTVYGWDEIVDLVHHKKSFRIEARDTRSSAQFYLPDVETAKYVWKMCVQQHKFFMSAKESETKATLPRASWDLNGNRASNTQPAEESSNRDVVQTDDCNSTAESLKRLPSYRQAPDYETAIRTKYGTTSVSLNDLSSHKNHPLLPPLSCSQYGNFVDLTELRDSLSNLNEGPPMHTYSTPELATAHMSFQYKPPPPYPYGQRSSSSTPDLTRNTLDTGLLSRRAHVEIPSFYEQVCAKPIHTTYVTIGESWSARTSSVSTGERVQASLASEQTEEAPVGPMMMAAMNGLAVTRPHSQGAYRNGDGNVDAVLESYLTEGQVFLEFERITKKRLDADLSTALMPENASRNRFSDVLPYEENRVRLTPSTDNRTGYINASHVSASVGEQQRFYIAAQGPMESTAESFWQMVWENHVTVVVMLTETRDNQGRDKCHQYWPKDKGETLTFGAYHVVCKGWVSSSVAVTSSLVLSRPAVRSSREVWHLRYTDWPDHGCPGNVQGFLGFMEEVDSLRRLSPWSNSPVVVHCTAGVGRTGVAILCDILLFCLDHNVPMDIPRALTLVRMQRMLSVQTLAQYKFVYQVLVRHLQDSRLI
uniref:protein-tyrosine-phosphatase n=1 Tax=Ornithodoros turicata TaxID=34597 RepID=A0A2R5LMI5_9ACAR